MKHYTLITGASSGLGAEFARICAGQNQALILTARDTRKLKQLAKELAPVEVIIFTHDLSIPGAGQKLYAKIKHYPVSRLINNAGFGDYGEFLSSKLSTQLEMINLNIAALTELTYLIGQDMIKTKKGRIMNVASTAAFLPGPLMSVYFATKHYVLSFSEAIAEELAGRGVSVTALCPGPTATNFAAAAHAGKTNVFKGRLPSARTVANFGYQAMESGKAVAIYGLSNKLAVFITRLLPRVVTRKLVHLAQG